MRKGVKIIGLILLFNSVVVLGQDNNLPGVMPSLFYRGRISNRFDYNIFASSTFIPVRSIEQEKEYKARISEVFLQSSFIYKYSKEINFALGYTYLRGNSFSDKAETSHQIWQQVIVEHRIFKSHMLHRFRLVEEVKSTPDLSLNYQIAYEKPLQGRILDVKEFYFTCLNESFVNLSSSQMPFYTANWTFAGIGYKTERAGKIEVGPLVQTTFTNHQGQNTLFLLQILWLTDYTIHKRKK